MLAYFNTPGLYEFSKTGQLLPILVGTTMEDASTGKQVPILGAEHSRSAGDVVPVAGTMEDPEGSGMYIFKLIFSLW